MTSTIRKIVAGRMKATKVACDRNLRRIHPAPGIEGRRRGRGPPSRRFMVGSQPPSGCSSGPSARYPGSPRGDRKSTRLNSSHQIISYAVFCLKKKKKTKTHVRDNTTYRDMKS